MKRITGVSSSKNKPFLLLMILLALSACRKSSDSSSLENTAPSEASTATTTVVASPSPTSTATNPAACTTTVIDRGTKGAIAAVARGNYSDIQKVPNSLKPAFAYNDAGSISLKFTWKNPLSSGDVDTTEIVAGESAAAFVQLGFLSDSTPIIAWTSGTSVKVAVRSTALPGAGTWTAAVIDTGVAPRALKMAVNPIDQVGMVYLTDTATTGRARFAYCNSPCTHPSNFQTQSATPYIVDNATAITGAQNQIGFGWCKASSSVYYPATTVGIGTTTKYASCLNTLSNCLTATNWGSNWTTNASVSGTIGSTASSLYLDPTVTGDVPKAIAAAATGMATALMGATACTAAPVALTAGTVVGAANTGGQWHSILKDPAGKFHIIANAGPSSGVLYYNSTTTTFNSTWNALGTIETVTLPNPIGGGAYLDSSTGSINISYGQGAGFFDQRLGIVQSYSVSSAAAVFSNSSVDSNGNIQLTAAAPNALANISLAKTSAGRPAVAYIDFSNGAATSARLKYALRDGNSAADSWSINIVGGPISPQFPSLAFDENNRPWISYFEASTNRFQLLKGPNTDGSGTWINLQVPTAVSGAPIALPAANNTSLAMYYSGGVAQPVVIFIDNNAGSRGLKAIKYTPSTGLWSQPAATLDALSASGASHLSSAFDTAGNIAVVFRDLTSTRPKYVMSSDASTWTTPLNIGSTGLGAGASIAINPVNSKPAAAFYDKANNSVWVTTCSGTPASCATTGWTPVQIDSTAGVSGLASSAEQVLSTGIQYNASGTLSVAYPRGSTSTGALTLYDTTTGTAGIYTIASGANGNSATVGTVPALNFGIQGWNAAAIRNSRGGMTTVHVGPGDWLYSTSCND